MAAIRSLLNPAPELSKGSKSEPALSSKSNHHSQSSNSSHQSRKKQKLCKDAAVFSRGPVRGECRYPPHEYQDGFLAAQHQQFEVFPMGEIADYPRHIPYNSEKKFFFEKTGRESLEVFQYNFKVPGDDTQYAMLWDYNIGLVRTTPLFKCTGHSKTTPAKMLNRNPGLRDICHSITGGALVAQGYWMPYDAAKAVAATFCWNIRYALTPVFGTDFPAMCISPNSDNFGDMSISPNITKRCTEQANMYRDLESQSASRPASATPAPLTPDTPTYPKSAKQFRPKALKIVTSAYSSDTGGEDDYVTPTVTPEPSHRAMWTPANTPRSVPHLPLPTCTRLRKHPIKLKLSNNISSPELSPKSHPRCDQYVDEQHDSDSSDGLITDSDEYARKGSIGLPSDEKAAYLLMSLKLQTDTLCEGRGRKRRAST